jgi:hypothetical protein
MERNLDDKIGALGLQDHDASDLADSNEQRSAEEREKRNFTHSHLCQLAPELLGRILFFAQIPQGPTSHALFVPLSSIEFDRRWINYTLVCRYMRTVAIETPYLWTFIECDPFEPPSDLTRLYVARAKGYALDMDLGPKTSSWSDSARNVDAEFRTYLAMARRVWLSLSQLSHTNIIVSRPTSSLASSSPDPCPS